MNLHEYQAKALFAEYGLPVSKGQAVDSPEQLPLRLRYWRGPMGSESAGACGRAG